MTQRRQLITNETNGDVEAIVAARTSSDPHLRALCLGSLDRMGELTDEHLDDALSDQDRNVRVRAIELAHTRLHIELVQCLDDTDDLVVETAAWALGERQDSATATLNALINTATSHEISICREAAIAALGAIGHPRGVRAILGGLDDRAPVRRRAVLALAPFDSPEVTAALETALTDRDRQVRQAAQDLL